MTKKAQPKTRGRKRMQELGYIEARYWVTPQEKKKLDAAFASVKQERTKKSRLEIALATMERSRNRSD